MMFRTRKTKVGIEYPVDGAGQCLSCLQAYPSFCNAHDGRPETRAKIAELEASLRKACAYLSNYVLWREPRRQDDEVGEFLASITEYSGVTTHTSTANDASKG